MSTLNEWLALLPDNSTGAIDAADLRSIVTDVWNTDAELTARIGALENTGDGGIITVAGRWQINPQAGAIPGGQQVTADTNDLSEATWLRFTPFDQKNDDMTNFLMNATAIYAQQQANAANWTYWDAPGAGVSHGSYIEVPVTFVRGEGSLVAAAWQSGVFAFTVPHSVVE